ncbi:XPG-like endonuclease [Arctopsyche grandis]|uniref:XPG-like endonuclease n=1 Tax=Arctopsyche grandis TaxID=121162 RepID=UPI00406D819E
MGVKGLWNLLAPYAQTQPLYQLRGEKVAIDLSGWVCDSQNVADQFVQPRLYLRNLYFRASYLVMNGITPIFVLEGEAPKLKQNTMANRNLIQFQNHPNAKRLRKPCTKRTRFKSVLTQCEKLLNSMGLECVRGFGEAEAMCAHLNATGVVSAVISQDSDCFVYGATRVYRNFSISNSGTSAANSGSVDVYDLNKIRNTLDFGRNKMVALALLCGSDYNGSGIEGVGITNAINFLKTCSNETVLNKLSSWVSEPHVYDNISKSIDNPNLCSGCGHHGNIRSHTRHGCNYCKTSIGCSVTDYKDRLQQLKIESSIRNKILKNPSDFPSRDLIDEYLIDKEVTPENFKSCWRSPDLIKFVKLMSQSLDWKEIYCVEKFLPLITKWQLMCKAKNNNSTDIFVYVNDCNNHLWIKPLFIKKCRNPKGVACYEIVWKDSDGHYEGLISDDQFEEKSEEDLWTTVEQQYLVEIAYPEIIETFMSLKKNKKKPKVTKKVAKSKKCESKNMDNCNDNVVNVELEHLNVSMKNLSIKNNAMKNIRKRKGVSEVSFKTKPRKYKRKGLENNNTSQRKIDSFLKIQQSKVNKNLFDKDSCQKESKMDVVDMNSCSLLSVKNHISRFQNKLETTDTSLNPFDLDSTNDDIDNSELSHIIDGILERKDNFYDNIFDGNCSTPLKEIQNISSFNKMTPHIESKKIFIQNQCSSTPLCSNTGRMSHFFGDLNEVDDAFEKSLDLKNYQNESHKRNSSQIHSMKKSWKNHYKTLHLSKNEKLQNSQENILNYTPLLERIRRLKESNH